MQISWLALGWVLAFGAPQTREMERAELAIVLHDSQRRVTTALRLSASPALAPTEFADDGRSLWVRLGGAPSADAPATAPTVATAPAPTVATATAPMVSVSRVLGHTSGRELARSLMTAQVRRWPDMRNALAAGGGPGGLSSFEGASCQGCLITTRPGVQVISIGFTPDVLQEIIGRVMAVHVDAADQLLALAADAGSLWPHSGGPRSAMLMRVGPNWEREFIAVDRSTQVGRRLNDRHLRHLADVELPTRLLRAQQALSEGDFERHQRLALRAGRRAQAAFPFDRRLRRTLAVARTLRFHAKPLPGPPPTESPPEPPPEPAALKPPPAQPEIVGSTQPVSAVLARLNAKTARAAMDLVLKWVSRQISASSSQPPGPDAAQEGTGITNSSQSEAGLTTQ